jgi:CoA:oxalate CoA-transferase
VPVKLSDTPGAVDRPAPRLGQDNVEILTELGYTEAELRDLKAKGVI